MSFVRVDDTLEHGFQRKYEDEKIKSDGARKRIAHAKIDTFFKRLCHVVEGSEMLCFIARMDKRPYKNAVAKYARKKGVSDHVLINYLKRAGLHDFLYESLTRKLILEFGYFLEIEKAHGEVVAESRRNDDQAVLTAFLSATDSSNYDAGTLYHSWSQFSFRRIHGLTFQNKKGLSFGLEIADLFAWSHFNKHYGKNRTYPSQAKNNRIDHRISKADQISRDLCTRKKPEDITASKLRTLAKDRVSEFTDALKAYRSSVPSGTLPGIPDRP